MSRKHNVAWAMLFLFVFSFTAAVTVSVDVFAGEADCCFLDPIPGCTAEGGRWDCELHHYCMHVLKTDPCYAEVICN